MKSTSQNDCDLQTKKRKLKLNLTHKPTHTGK